MSHKTVSTTQGQAWDQIAREQYGSEMAMHKLFADNSFARGTLLFKADQKIKAPVLETPVETTDDLPPWLR